MKYKLLVVDIDGTLVDKRGIVSAEDKAALAEAVAAGVCISLCTGRVSEACRKITRQLPPLDGYHIFADGAIVCNPEQCREVYARPIDPAVVKQAVDYAREHDMELELYSPTQYFARRETWSTGAHREFFGIEPTIGDFDGLWRRERIIKGGMAITNAEESRKAKRMFSDFADRLDVSWAWTPAYPDVNFLNIVAPEVSKGKALEALAAHMRVPMSQVIAVGDGNNDLTLLSTAGLSIAMENAPAEIKAVADYVTRDVEHSGLAAAIKKFVV